jgi:lysophospholipase L1-like esterase
MRFRRFSVKAFFKVACSASVLLSACVLAAAQSPASSQSAPNCAELPALKESLGRAEARLKDWPLLSRYGDANTKMVAPGKNELRVVFMGDSITDSWGKPGQAEFFPGKPYINRGISGQTTPQMLIRFRPDVIAMQPKVVVILAGTNDLAGNTGPMTLAATEDNLASMAELARAHGIRVVLASLLPVSDYGHNREGKPIKQTERRPPEKIKELNQWIKRHAAENGYTYLDYFAATVDEAGMLKKEISDDGLHPNAKGYAVMQPLAEQAINAAMKKKR